MHCPSHSQGDGGLQGNTRQNRAWDSGIHRLALREMQVRKLTSSRNPPCQRSFQRPRSSHFSRKTSPQTVSSRGGWRALLSSCSGLVRTAGKCPFPKTGWAMENMTQAMGHLQGRRVYVWGVCVQVWTCPWMKPPPPAQLQEGLGAGLSTVWPNFHSSLPILPCQYRWPSAVPAPRG